MNMQILGGFIAALGLAAIAIAFTVNQLFGTSEPSIPVDGAFAFVLGLGIFAAGRQKPGVVNGVVNNVEAAKAAPEDESKAIPVVS